MIFNRIYYEKDWMDSPETEDISLTDKSYLVSQRFETYSPEILNQPVVIACHGFSASTFEWTEFRQYVENKSAILVSLVLLGAHGRDIETFKKSTWQEWGAPILEEYNRLVSLGFTSIVIAGASTSATLILHYLSENKLENTHPLKRLFFVDPFLFPVDKKLSWIRYIGFIIQNIPDYKGRNSIKLKHWYNNHPAQTLKQLITLTSKVKKALKKGIKLPDHTELKIYQSKEDPVSDPTGASFIASKLQRNKKNPVIEFVTSHHHVFIQGAAYNATEWSSSDEALQKKVFDNMMGLILSNP